MVAVAVAKAQTDEYICLCTRLYATGDGKGQFGSKVANTVRSGAGQNLKKRGLAQSFWCSDSRRLKNVVNTA